MTKRADIGSKRLISLAPETWVQWLTGDPTVEVLDFLSGEFQWVARATDVLIKTRSATHGTFLIANEVQFRPDARMPVRTRAYAALAEEKFGINVFPVVVNILPPDRRVAIVDSYHSEFMGLIAHQDFKVLNLWEVDVAQVLENNWTTLLPFAPVLRGGQDRLVVHKALTLLRSNDQLADLETLLAFFATFVMTPGEVQQLMRWNMAMLRESPWYSEIMNEGLEEGLQQGLQRGLQQGLQQGRQEGEAEILLLVLNGRFGSVTSDLTARIQRLNSEGLRELATVVATAPTLEAVEKALASLRVGFEKGNGGDQR